MAPQSAVESTNLVAFFVLHIFFPFARLVFALLVISNTPLISLSLSFLEHFSVVVGFDVIFSVLIPEDRTYGDCSGSIRTAHSEL